MSRRAWTAQAVSAAIPGATVDLVERVLEHAAAAGECVRLASAGQVFYVGTSAREALDALEALPAMADDVDALRAGLTAQHSEAERLTMIRERIRRALQPSTTTKGSNR